MELQGTMLPTQIISLMDIGGTTFAMGDHADHVHVGYAPVCGPAPDPDKQSVAAPEARPVGAPDRPHRRDRQPGRAHLALQVLAARGEGQEVEQGLPRLQRPRRRVASPP